MRSANDGGTTVSASRKAPRAARVPTKPAYNGGQVGQASRWDDGKPHQSILTISTEPVDGKVVKNAMQPGGQRRLTSKGLGSFQGAQQRLLHKVLGQLSVRLDGAGIPEQTGNLGGESAANIQGGHDRDASAKRCATQ